MCYWAVHVYAMMQKFVRWSSSNVWQLVFPTYVYQTNIFALMISITTKHDFPSLTIVC